MMFQVGGFCAVIAMFCVDRLAFANLIVGMPFSRPYCRLNMIRPDVFFFHEDSKLIGISYLMSMIVRSFEVGMEASANNFLRPSDISTRFYNMLNHL